jgi:broad specificity phosphatase PhoE
VAVLLTYETHALTEDNEQGVATGWLPGRLSPRGRREAALLGTPLAEAVAAPFAWQPGWSWNLE